MAKIFISYKRNVAPDTPVASAVYEALRNEHDVFIDTTIQIGEKWAERIQGAIREADYLISFLSEHSVNSEMVVAEIETAHQNNKAIGKPKILPVRLSFDSPLVYPLSAYLNPLQWAVWNGEGDTPGLIDELRAAIQGGQLSGQSSPAVASRPGDALSEAPTAFANIPRDLGTPEGTMPHESPFYIERESDQDALQSLREPQGVTITIKGPRQMGKSSLLNRLLDEGGKNGMTSAFIDFQLIEDAAMQDPAVFYRQFCSLLSYEFNIEDRTEEFWNIPLGQVQKTSNYVQRHLLKQIPSGQILLAMDEVERMFASPFRSDFFSMLRSWHNNRARGGDWTRFNIALVTSTEPYQLIANLNQSPFNVGTVVELADFSDEQTAELNRRHGGPLNPAQLARLADLLDGHPYLTRRALYLIASQRIAFEALMEKATEDDGPFGDHLRNHLFRMSDHPEMRAGLAQIIRFHRCADEHVFFQLRGAGLVKRIDNRVEPRISLYGDYFGKRING